MTNLMDTQVYDFSKNTMIYTTSTHCDIKVALPCDNMCLTKNENVQVP